MTREFPEELLSALIDDELSPAERDQVEQHLATCEADQKLVAELRMLRSEVASLPPVVVGDDFTDRVLRAAIAEAEKNGMAVGPMSVPDSVQVKRSESSSGSTAAILPDASLPGIILAEAE